MEWCVCGEGGGGGGGGLDWTPSQTPSAPRSLVSGVVLGLKHLNILIHSK